MTEETQKEENILISEKNCRAAAYYGSRCIQDYINAIRESCSPQTPEEYGGAIYVMFLGHLEVMERILNGESVEGVMADRIKQKEEQDEG